VSKALKKIVSITPLPLERDSRTLKIAASFARWGYESTVVENRPSSPTVIADFEATHGITVLTLPGGKPVGASPTDVVGRATNKSDSFSMLRQKFFALLPPQISEVAHYILFRALYEVIRPIFHSKLIPNADIFYLHEYRLFPMVRKKLSSSSDAKLIYDAHDYYPEVDERDNDSYFRERFFRPYLELLELKSIRRANQVVTVGEHVRQLISERFSCSPMVIRNCHDDRMDTKTNQGLRKKLELDDSIFLVVAIGNRKPGFAVETILNALVQLARNVHMVFIGRYHEKSAEQALEKGLSERVHFTGGLHPHDIVPNAKECDLALVPYVPVTSNVSGILPNGFFQSVSAHIPLVLPRLVDLETVVGTAKHVQWIDFADVNALIEAVGRSEREAYRNEKSENDQNDMHDLSDQLAWRNEEKKLLSLIR
jgi:glycosyltransferase involved in cell wall biosynthesis